MFQTCVSNVPKPCKQCGPCKQCEGGEGDTNTAEWEQRDPMSMSTVITALSMQWDSKEGSSTSFFDILGSPRNVDVQKTSDSVQGSASKATAPALPVLSESMDETGDQRRPSVASVESDEPLEEAPTTKRKERRKIEDMSCFRLCGDETHEKVVVDELELLKKGWWCLYCCCTGCGCGPQHPYIFDAKCICCRHGCSTSHCCGTEGILSDVLSCCCCHLLCQLPPRNETPRCVCCNEVMFGVHRHSRRSYDSGENPFQTFDHILHEAFMLAYCVCGGCAVSSIEITELCRHFYKCCCCKVHCEVGLPTLEDGWCHYLWVCCCVFSQCRFPLKIDGNPLLEVCGYKCRKENSRSPSSSNVTKKRAAPEQQEMQ